MRIKIVLNLSITLVLLFSSEHLYTQGKIVDLDSLFSGGVYNVFLLEGTQFQGEFISQDSLRLKFDVAGDIKEIGLEQIKYVQIPDFHTYSSEEESVYSFQFRAKKFSLMGWINAGISTPTGDFDDIHENGFCITVSIYHLFDRLMGVGTELQYNIFPGDIYVYNDGYSESRSQSESYSIYSLKVNLLVGNLRPEDYLIIYGLFGVGLHYYLDGTVISTYSHPYGTYTYVSPSNSGLSFLFGAGTGMSYKISNKIRLNGELQYNKLPRLDYNFAHNYESNDFDGYFSFKAGIIYTY